LALTACGGAPAPTGPPPVSVTSTHIARGTIATYVSFDGQISSRYQTTLSTAEAGTVASVDVTAQVASVYVVASVPDVDLAHTVRGKTMSFTTPSFPGRTYHGRIFDVNITPTSGTRSHRAPGPRVGIRSARPSSAA
jgi:hypothetical protein